MIPTKFPKNRGSIDVVTILVIVLIVVVILVVAKQL